jgi:outer membrane protein
MKNLKLLTVILMLLVGSVTVVAQDLGYADPYEIVNAMPEKKSADAELDALYKKHQTEIKRQQDALTAIENEVQAKVQNKTDAEIQAMKAELQAKQQDYATKQQALVAYQQAASKEVTEKEAALMKPINEKAKAAIDKVAAAKGLKYVVDASVLLYVNNGIDITPDVKKELGIN